VLALLIAAIAKRYEKEAKRDGFSNGTLMRKMLALNNLIGLIIILVVDIIVCCGAWGAIMA
jgi:hypothetical protein